MKLRYLVLILAALFVMVPAHAAAHSSHAITTHVLCSKYGYSFDLPADWQQEGVCTQSMSASSPDNVYGFNMGTTKLSMRWTDTIAKMVLSYDCENITDYNQVGTTSYSVSKIAKRRYVTAFCMEVAVDGTQFVSWEMAGTSFGRVYTPRFFSVWSGDVATVYSHGISIFSTIRLTKPHG